MPISRDPLEQTMCSDLGNWGRFLPRKALRLFLTASRASNYPRENALNILRAPQNHKVREILRAIMSK